MLIPNWVGECPRAKALKHLNETSDMFLVRPRDRQRAQFRLFFDVCRARIPKIIRVVVLSVRQVRASKAVYVITFRPVWDKPAASRSVVRVLVCLRSMTYQPSVCAHHSIQPQSTIDRCPPLPPASPSSGATRTTNRGRWSSTAGAK